MKVEIKGETPSEQLVAAAAQQVVVTDDAGRRITLQKPKVLAQFKIVQLLGADASNMAYRNMVMPLIFVTAIDDELVLLPKTPLALDALIQKLDEHGVNAVMEAVMENWGQAEEEADKDTLRK